MRDVSFALYPREAYGLVGESGCGKSTIAFAIMRYLPANGRVSAGQIVFDGRDLLAPVRGRAASACAATASPWSIRIPAPRSTRAMTVGDQVAEVFEIHKRLSRAQARAAAVEMFERVRMPGAADVAAALSPPTQRRHAAARDHRHGPGHQSIAADPRRADHRPRRHGRGGRARPDRGDSRRVQRGDPLHQPQPGRGRAAVRPRRRALRRRVGRAGRRRRSCSPRRIIPTRRACSRACRASARARTPTRSCPSPAACRAWARSSAVAPSRRAAPWCRRSACRRSRRWQHHDRGRLARCFFWPQVADGCTPAHRRARSPRTASGPVRSDSEQDSAALLDVQHAERHFGRAHVRARERRLLYHADARQIFGLVGESGSGKSTVARCIAGLIDLTGGTLTLDGPRYLAAGRAARARRGQAGADGVSEPRGDPEPAPDGAADAGADGARP